MRYSQAMFIKAGPAKKKLKRKMDTGYPHSCSVTRRLCALIIVWNYIYQHIERVERKQTDRILNGNY